MIHRKPFGAVIECKQGKFKVPFAFSSFGKEDEHLASNYIDLADNSILHDTLLIEPVLAIKANRRITVILIRANGAGAMAENQFNHGRIGCRPIEDACLFDVQHGKYAELSLDEFRLILSVSCQAS